MRKVLVIVMTLILTMSFITGCGTENVSQETTNIEETLVNDETVEQQEITDYEDISSVIETSKPKETKKKTSSKAKAKKKPKTEESKTTTDDFIKKVKNVIKGAINSSEESIDDVELKGRELCVYVNLSQADPGFFTIEDLALSRTSSITDEILELKKYDSQWDSITIDFGYIGKVTNTKSDIEKNGFGGRYFPPENFVLE